MKSLDLYVMLKDTKHFKKGQKVWEWIPTGALAALVIGRFKNKGKWISAWIKIQPAKEYDYPHQKPNARWAGTVSVSNDFHAYYQKIICRIVGNDYYFKNGI